MATYYEYNGAAKICEYTNTPGAEECTESKDGGVYYKIQAQKCTDPASKAKRGFDRGGACCGECESCDCTCHYAETVPGTYDDVQLAITGVSICGGAPTDLDDHWDEIEDLLATEHNLSNTGGAASCRWWWLSSETWDIEIGGWTGTFSLNKWVEDNGGKWEIGAAMQLVSGGPPGRHDIGLFTTGAGDPCSYAAAPDVICSDESIATPNVLDSGDCGNGDNMCALEGYAAGTNEAHGGTATLVWEIDATSVTPFFYDIDFTDQDAAGKTLEICSDCNEQGAVGQAIVMLLDPDNYAPIIDDDPLARAFRFVQTLADPCRWELPRLRIRGSPGWWLTGRLRQTADGTDTDWDLDLYVENLKHRTSRTAPGFTHENCFCYHQRDRHNFWGGTGVTQGQYNCDNPPAAFDNQLTCGSHADAGAGNPEDFKDWTPCGQYGRATLTPGP